MTSSETSVSTSTNSAPGITGLIEQSAGHWRVYDLGRGCHKIKRKHFRAFEAGTRPYPYPLARQAWFAILFWDTENRSTNKHLVWFLHLPLDEQGLLNPAALDDFLRQFWDKAQAASDNGELNQAALGAMMDDNPYAFRPRQETLAIFHSHASLALGLPPCEQYAHAQSYICGEHGYEQWQFVGLQGLTDVATRLQQDNNEECLTKAVSQLPLEPFNALASALENQPISHGLTTALQYTLNQADNADHVALCIRSCAQSKAPALRNDIVRSALCGKYGAHEATLRAVASRHWQALHETDIAHQFLENLAASTDRQALFNELCTDLVFLPGMRDPLLGQFRSEQRSANLTKAIGDFFNAIRDTADNQ